VEILITVVPTRKYKRKKSDNAAQTVRKGRLHDTRNIRATKKRAKKPAEKKNSPDDYRGGGGGDTRLNTDGRSLKMENNLCAVKFFSLLFFFSIIFSKSRANRKKKLHN